jgi:hypothetical protein
VQVNLAYRWFCKLGIEDSIPDPPVSAAPATNAFARATLCAGFSGVVAKCIAAGLVGGQGIFTAASLIKAAVDKKKRVRGEQPIAWPKAEQASRASPNCPQGKLAFASAPSASSAALLGTGRGGREPGRQLSSQTCRTSGLLF